MKPGIGRDFKKEQQVGRSDSPSGGALCLALLPDMPSPAVRTFNHRDFPVDRLVEAKGTQRISLCLPARNEAPTIRPIVSAARRHLMGKEPLIDEIVVVDDGSTDGTPGRA